MGRHEQPHADHSDDPEHGEHSYTPEEGLHGGRSVSTDVDVSVVTPDQRDAGTAQTAGGLHRWAAVSEAMNGASFWMGFAVLDPGGQTGVHHHGEAETAIYILKGTTRWWVGDRLDEPREATAGDFVHIPAGVVHWEQNASDTEPVEMVVVRSTQEAVVVNLHDHPHAPEHAR
ncbi:Cupin domain-containing protein [Quadrisphaera granulorum]|uniref:Cupin domain-containing protein n=1 Tax=Quadrisphaera granulorum TaxID=317664 RepID=A0A316ATM3_9ACTN|nr:cupin domain-containing protein [Quadrisphaera granulorum]PWJ53527.1 Cupin domain-containing protein [Quadrisphaera granulorum]SZE96869.1 Cupin domain-containing protein [Quadrisphaera granulorum]